MLADGVKLALLKGMKIPDLRPLRLLILYPLLFTGTCLSVSASPTLDVSAVETRPDIQPLDSIRMAVESFISLQQSSDNSVNISVKQLDRRLRLAFCLDPLSTSWSPGSKELGRVTVQVACSAPRLWRVHIQATVTMEGMVWTMTRGVQRGEILSRDIVLRQEVTLGSNNTAFTSLGTPIEDIERWLGYEFTQRVNSGKVLNERMLKPARLLTKGDAVVIRHRSPGLELETRGVALSDAGARQQTQVRNSSSGKVIDVKVISPGLVEILQ